MRAIRAIHMQGIHSMDRGIFKGRHMRRFPVRRQISVAAMTKSPGGATDCLAHLSIHTIPVWVHVHNTGDALEADVVT